MDPATLLQLLTTGGSTTALVVVLILILRGELVTGKSADERVTAVQVGGAALIAELSSARDEWKTLAKDSIADVGELAQALNVRNRIDEGLAKRVDEFIKVKP